MPTHISIPPIPEFRTHIFLVLALVESYLGATRAGLLPADTPLAQSIPNIVGLPEAKALKEKFQSAPPDDKLTLTHEESVRLYASYVLLSLLLVSPDGEALCELMYSTTAGTSAMEEEDDMRDFPRFRSMMLSVNDHLIADSDRILADVPGYADMKARLQLLAG